MKKKFLWSTEVFAVLVFLLLPLCAFGQTAKTRSALYTEVNANFADNTGGAITPLILRNTVADMIASAFNPATDGSAAGLSANNTWTGTNGFQAITVTGLTNSGSETIAGTLTVTGGINSSPIGQITPLAGSFTTLSSTLTATLGGSVIAGSTVTITATASGAMLSNPLTVGPVLISTGANNTSNALLRFDNNSVVAAEIDAIASVNGITLTGNNVYSGTATFSSTLSVAGTSIFTGGMTVGNSAATTNISLGVGGTGSYSNGIIINSSNAGGGYGPYLQFLGNAVSQGYIGSQDAIIGSATHNIAIAATNSTNFYTNGTTLTLTLGPAQQAIFAGPVVHKTYTVATLPAAASYTDGIVFVSDSTSAAGAGLGVAPTGSGSNVRAVYSTGSAWLQL